MAKPSPNHGQINLNQFRSNRRRPLSSSSVGGYLVRTIHHKIADTRITYKLSKVNFDNRGSSYELSKLLGLTGKILVYSFLVFINF